MSLDQFRGYTVAGMFLVNFLGGYAVVPALLKHHNTYCSYADTIMPQFFFAVGFAFRLTFLRRIAREGARTAYLRAIQRGLGLVLLGMVFYTLDGHYEHWAALREVGWRGVLATAFRSEMWQALVHIGVTGLWVLPVIAAGPLARLVFLLVSAGAYMVMLHAFYFDWVMQNAWDGGPLGFMTWTIPALAGTYACDWITARGPRGALKPLFGWALGLMGLGYAFACLSAVRGALHGDAAATGLRAILVEPPFVAPSRPVDIWTMSQRSGSISYLTFSTGFSLAVYALFVVLCDLATFRAGVFRTLGTNALAGYLIHAMVAEAVTPFCPGDAPAVCVLSCFCVYFAISWLFVRALEKQGVFLRL